MEAYSLIIIFSCMYTYTSVDIRPEMRKNILNFRYGINFSCEGMLSHSIGRFYIVPNLFYLPQMELRFHQFLLV